MMTITLRFGAVGSFTTEMPAGSTVGQAIERGALPLGYGTNVQARINGVPQQPGAPVSNGDVLFVETSSGTKFAA